VRRAKNFDARRPGEFIARLLVVGGQHFNPDGFLNIWGAAGLPLMPSIFAGAAYI